MGKGLNLEADPTRVKLRKVPHQGNRPLFNCSTPLFKKRLREVDVDKKKSIFILIHMKLIFHKKDFAFGLLLKVRVFL